MPETKKTLVVVPTKFEKKQIESELNALGSPIEVCGFGPVVAGARTVQLIQQHQPAHVLLVGIAGTYSAAVEIGEAYSFSRVSIYGMGAGTGADFQTAGEMGWNQGDLDSITIGDTLKLQPLGKSTSGELLTVCAAAGSKGDAELRTAKYPDAVAEDMEAFAVAAACRLSGIPLSVVRGISNRAGDRDKSNWKIQTALAAVSAHCVEHLPRRRSTDI